MHGNILIIRYKKKEGDVDGEEKKRVLPLAFDAMMETQEMQEPTKEDLEDPMFRYLQTEKIKGEDKSNIRDKKEKKLKKEKKEKKHKKDKKRRHDASRSRSRTRPRHD